MTQKVVKKDELLEKVGKFPDNPPVVILDEFGIRIPRVIEDPDDLRHLRNKYDLKDEIIINVDRWNIKGKKKK